MYDQASFNGRNVVALNGPPFTPANGPYETDTAHSVDESEFKLGAITLHACLQRMRRPGRRAA